MKKLLGIIVVILILYFGYGFFFSDKAAHSFVDAVAPQILNNWDADALITNAADEVTKHNHIAKATVVFFNTITADETQELLHLAANTQSIKIEAKDNKFETEIFGNEAVVKRIFELAKTSFGSAVQTGNSQCLSLSIVGLTMCHLDVEFQKRKATVSIQVFKINEQYKIFGFGIEPTK